MTQLERQLHSDIERSKVSLMTIVLGSLGINAGTLLTGVFWFGAKLSEIETSLKYFQATIVRIERYQDLYNEQPKLTPEEHTRVLRLQAERDVRQDERIKELENYLYHGRGKQQ